MNMNNMPDFDVEPLNFSLHDEDAPFDFALDDSGRSNAHLRNSTFSNHSESLQNSNKNDAFKSLFGNGAEDFDRMFDNESLRNSQQQQQQQQSGSGGGMMMFMEELCQPTSSSNPTNNNFQSNAPQMRRQSCEPFMSSEPMLLQQEPSSNTVACRRHSQPESLEHFAFDLNDNVDFDPTPFKVATTATTKYGRKDSNNRVVQNDNKKRKSCSDLTMFEDMGIGGETGGDGHFEFELDRPFQEVFVPTNTGMNANNNAMMGGAVHQARQAPMKRRATVDAAPSLADLFGTAPTAPPQAPRPAAAAAAAAAVNRNRGAARGARKNRPTRRASVDAPSSSNPNPPNTLNPNPTTTFQYHEALQKLAQSMQRTELSRRQLYMQRTAAAAQHLAAQQRQLQAQAVQQARVCEMQALIMEKTRMLEVAQRTTGGQQGVPQGRTTVSAMQQLQQRMSGTVHPSQDQQHQRIMSGGNASPPTVISITRGNSQGSSSCVVDPSPMPVSSASSVNSLSVVSHQETLANNIKNHQAQQQQQQQLSQSTPFSHHHQQLSQQTVQQTVPTTISPNIQEDRSSVMAAFFSGSRGTLTNGLEQSRRQLRACANASSVGRRTM